MISAQKLPRHLVPLVQDYLCGVAVGPEGLLQRLPAPCCPTDGVLLPLEVRLLPLAQPLSGCCSLSSGKYLMSQGSFFLEMLSALLAFVINYSRRELKPRSGPLDHSDARGAGAPPKHQPQIDPALIHAPGDGFAGRPAWQRLPICMHSRLPSKRDDESRWAAVLFCHSTQKQPCSPLKMNPIGDGG